MPMLCTGCRGILFQRFFPSKYWYTGLYGGGTPAKCLDCEGGTCTNSLSFAMVRMVRQGQETQERVGVLLGDRTVRMLSEDFRFDSSFSLALAESDRVQPVADPRPDAVRALHEFSDACYDLDAAEARRCWLALGSPAIDELEVSALNSRREPTVSAWNLVLRGCSRPGHGVERGGRPSGYQPDCREIIAFFQGTGARFSKGFRHPERVSRDILNKLRRCNGITSLNLALLFRFAEQGLDLGGVDLTDMMWHISHGISYPMDYAHGSMTAGLFFSSNLPPNRIWWAKEGINAPCSSTCDARTLLRRFGSGLSFADDAFARKIIVAFIQAGGDVWPFNVRGVSAATPPPGVAYQNADRRQVARIMWPGHFPPTHAPAAAGDDIFTDAVQGADVHGAGDHGADSWDDHWQSAEGFLPDKFLRGPFVQLFDDVRAAYTARNKTPARNWARRRNALMCCVHDRARLTALVPSLERTCPKRAAALKRLRSRVTGVALVLRELAEDGQEDVFRLVFAFL